MARRNDFDIRHPAQIHHMNKYGQYVRRFVYVGSVVADQLRAQSCVDINVRHVSAL